MMLASVVGMVFSVAALGNPECVTERVSGYELWGMRPKHRAVVNPVLGEEPGTTLDLSGEWEFTSRKGFPMRYPFWDRFQERDDWGKTRKIRLPGLLECQGVGEPGKSEPWDCIWDCSPKPLRHVFRDMGWLRRTVEIPADWTGRRIWLKLGDVTAQAWIWVNDRQVAWHENYCGTYKYEITDLVTPGKPAKIVIEVTNQVAKRGGTRNSMNKWTGIPRALTLEATPQTFIDDCWARGDFDGRCATVKVEVEGGGGQRKGDFSLRVTVDGETAEVSLSPSTSTYDLNLAFRAFRPWTPEQPNLYTAKVELVAADGTVLQTRRERFGVRKFEVRGRNFFLNGRPFFLRGVGYHNIQPVVGSDRIGDRDYRRREVAQMRAAGYNFVRTHTRCETPEFFDACDELGLMVQPELPYYTDQPTEKFAFDPVRDVTELYLHYRRHPSFAVYSHGNEGTFGPALSEHLYAYLKKIDPDRLVLDQDCDTFCGSSAYCKRHNAPGTSDFIGGPIMEWERGTCTSAYPIVCHEYLNRSIKANAALEDRYCGIWQVPYTRKMRRAWLAKFGLTDVWGDRLQIAQHKLQAFYLKNGIEWARLDPWCNGYYHWSAQDATTPQGDCFTAQGLFDPFWGVKPGGHTPQSFAVFNSEDCVLCDSPPESRIVVSGDVCWQKICFARYSSDEPKEVVAAWSVRDRKTGVCLAKGTTPPVAVPAGTVRTLQSVPIGVPKVAAPVAAALDVRIGTVTNSWDMWIFPKRTVKSAPGVCILPPFVEKLSPRYSDLVPTSDVAKASVVVCAADSADARAAAARGQSLVAIGPVGKKGRPKLGWWWLGDNVGMALAEHPALAGLPHADSVDGLFFRILGKGRLLPVAGVTEPSLVAVGEGKDACSLFVSVRQDGGRREALVCGLDVEADLPEAKALLDGILRSVTDYRCGDEIRLTFERPKDEPFVALTNLNWRLCKGVTIDGDILTVDAPAGAKGDFLAVADVDLSPYNAKGFEAKIDAWGENLTKPNPSWLGFKFMFSYKDPTSGYATYPEAPKLQGTFARQTFTVLDGSPCQGRIHGKLTLGLQGTTGRVSYDLSTLRIRAKGRARGLVNQDFKVKYPSRVTDRPMLRGVMLPGRPCTEKDLADLSAWGGTLARYQMIVRGKTEEEYDRDLEVWLRALEENILGWARKYGVMLVVDLHSLPGGRYPDRNTEPNAPGLPSDFRMLYEEKHARKFVAVWEKIATRLRGNEDIIYGYDLCNEPVQSAPPLVDYWELQRLAAEAVRRIDPETTIVIEADQWDNPEAFAMLSPLRMDNVIYQFHLYRPHELTHQRVGGDKDSEKPLLGYPNEARGWNRAFLEKAVADVVRFQKKHDAKIFVGEFSCITWTPGADRYIADCIDLFEAHGWDWTYHAFREWEGWSVEHEWRDRLTTRPVPSKDNPRMRALKAGLQRGRR